MNIDKTIISEYIPQRIRQEPIVTQHIRVEEYTCIEEVRIEDTVRIRIQVEDSEYDA